MINGGTGWRVGKPGRRLFSTRTSGGPPGNVSGFNLGEASAGLGNRSRSICPEDYIAVLDLCGSCRAIEEGRRVHGEIARRGLEPNVLLGNRLVQMYLRCDQPGEAELVFYRMARRDNPVHWTGMISTLARGFFFSSAWSVFLNMLLAGVCVDRCTLVTVIDLCRSLRDPGASSLIRSIVDETGSGSETRIGTALISLLQERVQDARRVFDEIQTKDVRAWNAIMEAHLRKHEYSEVINLFRKMDAEPDKASFVSVLIACAGSGALEDGRVFHQLASENGFGRDPEVEEAVFNLYTNKKNPDPVDRSSLILWTRRMAASTEDGDSERTLQLLQLMQLEGIKPDRVCLLTALNSLKIPPFLEQGKLIHSHAQELGLGLLTSLMNAVINMYSKCGSLQEAIRVFEMIEKDVVSWNTLLGAFVQSGHHTEALGLFHRMQLEGTLPDQVTLTIMLSVCTSKSWLRTGELIHSCLVQLGDEASLAHAISSMYGRCGRKLGAPGNPVLDRGTPDWNSKMAAHIQHGKQREALVLYKLMLLEGFIPDRVTFLTLLTAAQETSLDDTRLLESQAREAGLGRDTVLGTSLLDTFSKQGSLEEAHRVFTRLPPSRNIVSWTAMISACSHHNHLKQALGLFRTMQLEGVIPNKVTLAALSSARDSPQKELSEVRTIYHSFLPELELELATGNAALSVYSKLGDLRNAREVFSRMPDRSVVTWNTIISGYSDAGEGDESIRMFHLMQLESQAKPDKFTLIIALGACSLEPGKVVHQLANETGYTSDLLVGTALVHMYSQCGSLELAEESFNWIISPDTISWNALIAALSHHGEYQRALGCYHRMKRARVQADGITFVALLNACTAIAELHLGEKLLSEAIRSGFKQEVTNSAMNLMGKCGCLEAASSLFDDLRHQTILSWNGIINAYAQNGESDEALVLLGTMQLAGILPDSVTFVSILSTLSHSGLLEQACRSFSWMKRDYGIQPSPSHLGCIIDLLGRVGWLDEAEELLLSKLHLNSDGVLWTNLLAACQIHGDNQRGKRAVQELLELQPRDPGTYVVLSQITSGSSE